MKKQVQSVPPLRTPSSAALRGFTWLAGGTSILLFAGLVMFAWLDPEWFAQQLAKDRAVSGAGV